MKIALTFDAELPGREHADPDGPSKILDILIEYGVRSTWFMQGRWVRWQPDVARRAFVQGHLVGSHGHYHAPLTCMTPAGIAEDIANADEAIRAELDVDPRPYFRAPFGRVDADVVYGLAKAGYRHVGWSLDVADWELATTPDDIAARVIAGIRDYVLPIVLLHTWPRCTIAALPRFLEALSDHEFVTVADL